MKEKENDFLRVELVFSAALEEDIFNGFTKNGIGKKFTKIPSVLGKGNSNPKLGDPIWPQFNTMVIVYCDKAEAEKIYEIVNAIRKEYPVEGVACFEMPAIEH